MSEKVFKIVNDQIISALEEGQIPWRKPWVHHNFGPMNAISNKTYSGINFFLLALYPQSSPYWLTFNQIKTKKGKLKKGSKGAPVTFYKLLEGKDSKSGEDRKVPLLRYYTVFNADDVEGVKFPEIEKPDFNDNFEDIEKAEKILKICQSKTCEIEHIEQGQAYYKPISHKIVMPEKKQFHNPAEYYSTAFHEITHSTARPLERDMSGHFGDHLYSKEELIAEMGASYLCAFAGISPKTVENQMAYIQSWLKVLKNDPKFVIQAASKAQKAVNFLLEGSEFLAEREVA